MRMQMIAVFGATMIRLLGCTWRIEWHGEEHHRAARQHHPRVVYAFWHGRLLPMAWTHRNRGVRILASEHYDGERLGQVIRRLGFGHVRGSSTRGGTRALRALTRTMRSGYDVGLTVDGPRGPRYEVKPGALEVARQTGAAVLPITSASARHLTASSWDAFELPAPFTRIDITHGPPVIVPRDADSETIEAKRVELEQTLRAITEAADAGFR